MKICERKWADTHLKKIKKTDIKLNMVAVILLYKIMEDTNFRVKTFCGLAHFYIKWKMVVRSNVS